MQGVGGALAQRSCPTRAVIQGWGEDRGPLIARQPEWPARQPTVPMECIAVHKRPTPFSVGERGFVALPKGPA